MEALKNNSQAIVKGIDSSSCCCFAGDYNDSGGTVSS